MSLTKKDYLDGVAVIVYQDAASASEEGFVPILKFYGVDEAGRVYEGSQHVAEEAAGQRVKYKRSKATKDEVVAKCVFVGMDLHPFQLKSV